MASKHLEKLLVKYTPALTTYEQEIRRYLSVPLAIETEMDAQIEPVIKEMIKVELYELQDLLNRIHSEQFDEIDEIQIPIATQLLEKAIAAKKEASMTHDYPFEYNMARGGFFATKTPSMQDGENKNITFNESGELEIEKTGYAKVYFRNSNGMVLTPYDQSVFICIQKLWFTKGKQSVFSFSYKEMLDTLQHPDNAGEYQTLINSLNNLSATQVIMHEYLDPESDKATRTTKHNPIQTMRFNHNEYSVDVELSNYIQRSLEAGNAVHISIHLYNELNHRFSKNLYTFLLTFYRTTTRILDLDVLIEHLNMMNTRTKNVKLIEEGMSELVKVEILSRFDIVKQGRFYKRVIFEFHPKFTERYDRVLESFNRNLKEQND